MLFDMLRMGPNFNQRSTMAMDKQDEVKTKLSDLTNNDPVLKDRISFGGAEASPHNEGLSVFVKDDKGSRREVGQLDVGPGLMDLYIGGKLKGSEINDSEAVKKLAKEARKIVQPPLGRKIKNAIINKLAPNKL